MRLIIYPGAPSEALTELLNAYQQMMAREAIGKQALLLSTVHFPRPDRPMYVWLLESAIGPVGEVSLFNVDFYHGSAEIGIFTSKDCPKVLTRAFVRACGFAFNDLGLRRLEAYIRVNNGRAIRLAKRFGFRKEGVLRLAARADSGSVDVVVFGLLAEEFRERWGRYGGSGLLDSGRDSSVGRLQSVPSITAGGSGVGAPAAGDGDQPGGGAALQRAGEPACVDGRA